MTLKCLLLLCDIYGSIKGNAFAQKSRNSMSYHKSWEIQGGVFCRHLADKLITSRMMIQKMTHVD